MDPYLLKFIWLSAQKNVLKRNFKSLSSKSIVKYLESQFYMNKGRLKKLYIFEFRQTLFVKDSPLTSNLIFGNLFMSIKKLINAQRVRSQLLFLQLLQLGVTVHLFELQCAPHFVPISNVFIDWRFSCHGRKNLTTCFLVRNFFWRTR